MGEGLRSLFSHIVNIPFGATYTQNPDWQLVQAKFHLWILWRQGCFNTCCKVFIMKVASFSTSLAFGVSVIDFCKWSLKILREGAEAV